MNGSPKSLTIVQTIKNDLHLCLGFRTRFDVINVQTKEVSILKNFVAYRVNIYFCILCSDRMKTICQDNIHRVSVHYMCLYKQKFLFFPYLFL